MTPISQLRHKWDHRHMNLMSFLSVPLGCAGRLHSLCPIQSLQVSGAHVALTHWRQTRSLRYLIWTGHCFPYFLMAMPLAKGATWPGASGSSLALGSKTKHSATILILPIAFWSSQEERSCLYWTSDKVHWPIKIFMTAKLRCCKPRVQTDLGYLESP